MSENVIAAPAAARPISVAPSPERTVLAVLGAISLCHLLNDTIQSLLPAIYPVLKQSYDLKIVTVDFASDVIVCKVEGFPWGDLRVVVKPEANGQPPTVRQP